jgi:hypothetical protein
VHIVYTQYNAEWGGCQELIRKLRRGKFEIS